jgi:hypothetical protein
MSQLLVVVYYLWRSTCHVAILPYSDRESKMGSANYSIDAREKLHTTSTRSRLERERWEKIFSRS